MSKRVRFARRYLSLWLFGRSIVLGLPVRPRRADPKVPASSASWLTKAAPSCRASPSPRAAPRCRWPRFLTSATSEVSTGWRHCRSAMYTVEYSLSGFQGVRREDIRLTVGFVAKLDIVMKVGSMEETITVSGVSRRWSTSTPPAPAAPPSPRKRSK